MVGEFSIAENALGRGLTPESNVLNYRVMVERTAAPLRVGEFWAAVDFSLSYD
ncbi:hypothetical protein [Serratia marcescens]|jgi:hypothetical protein|uniref:hypothetical protein n=1 Tax=Serratia marcescens TaxID=615 RepID=UPI003204A178